MQCGIRLFQDIFSHKFPEQTGRRKIGTLPQLQATQLAISQNAEHVRHVDQHLKNRGIVKIGLQFDDDASTYLEQLILQLHKRHGHGLPITHSALRGSLWDIRPQFTKPPDTHTARSETMNEFPWHTDCSYEESPPRYFALQVIHPDKSGGGTLSVLDTSRLVSLLSPAARKGLTLPEFRIAVPPEFIKQDSKTHITGNLLRMDEAKGMAELRFREDLVTPLTAPAAAAFEELQRVLNSADLQSQVMQLTSAMLPRGSIVAIDNRRWLHGRNQVLDPNRHLRRVRWDAEPFNAL
ncbi:uncharacterized protein N7483_003110 [Penicillium malachiteum]|uniref:uncharacterized protein n=1 Tax=Penicillium malachiteum TaxID=1324776 RepID=UPI002549C069|nr:uncharacterized protein N7483_003110 [Penicillium malachiteum]KAJ5728602.1 hypothetical protein N7483_003110 [Penicillium malachiteum]